MRTRRRLSRRRRVLVAGIVMFCLLFQQLAMAAYVCTLPAGQAVAAMTRHCADMHMDSSGRAPAHSNPDPRCDEHCASHVSATPDARVPMVPPLALPPAPPALPGTIADVPEQAVLPDASRFPPEPPPSLRFCSLLI